MNNPSVSALLRLLCGLDTKDLSLSFLVKWRQSSLTKAVLEVPPVWQHYCIFSGRLGCCRCHIGRISGRCKSIFVKSSVRYWMPSQFHLFQQLLHLQLDENFLQSLLNLFIVIPFHFHCIEVTGKVVHFPVFPLFATHNQENEPQSK